MTSTAWPDEVVGRGEALSAARGADEDQVLAPPGPSLELVERDAHARPGDETAGVDDVADERPHVVAGHEQAVADAQHLVGAEESGGVQARAVDEGAVAAAQVLDGPQGAVEADLTVGARHSRVIEGEVGGLAAYHEHIVHRRRRAHGPCR